MKKIPISVIVTVLNEAHTVAVLLHGLAGQKYKANEIIIVDGGSRDGTPEILTRLAKQLKLPLTVLKKKGNRSVGRNAAITKAKNALIAITDAGCEPHPDWLTELATKYIAVKQTHPQKLVVVAGYYDARPQDLFTTAAVPYFLVMPDNVNPTHFLPATRSMLLEKEAWRQAGKFDERLDPSEDYAFAKKLEQMQSVILSFTMKAKVSWLPPRLNLYSFSRLVFKFAEGDSKAGILRTKVLVIYIRYMLLITAISLLALSSIKVALLFTLFCAVIYSAWAIAKNYRYVGRGWMYLPLLQVSSDIAVMCGVLRGTVYRFHSFS